MEMLKKILASLGKRPKITALIALVIVAVLTVTAVLIFLNRPKDDQKPQDNGGQTEQVPVGDSSDDVTDEPEPDVTDEPQDKPSQSTTPSGSKPSQSKPSQDKPAVVKTFTVVFKDYDGKVLKTQKVEEGKGATAPENPKRENYSFRGWDKAFDKVTADLVVTATYTTEKIIISAEDVTVNKGADTVSMNIRVVNNPAIMGAVIKVSVDDKVLGFESATKSAFPALTLTAPGPSAASSPYTFMLDALELSDEDKKDGTLFTVTFKIKDKAATGKFNVALSCDDGAIFDENYNTPEIILDGGVITVK